MDTASLEFEAAPEALEPTLRVQFLQNTRRGQGGMGMCIICSCLLDVSSNLEPRLSVPNCNFSPKLQDKMWSRKPGLSVLTVSVFGSFVHFVKFLALQQSVLRDLQSQGRRRESPWRTVMTLLALEMREATLLRVAR